MSCKVTSASLGPLLALAATLTVAPANAATTDPMALARASTPLVPSLNAAVSDQHLRAAGYESMAKVKAGGATGTLWRIIEPAGAWTWHANIHNAAPGSQVRAQNWYDNVVSSAVVPPGEIGVNTGTWSSFGKFRVCIRLTDGTHSCGYYSQT
ncbi:hypothetical protein [Lentzea californiensis]|uniref:hypothetical protein n=1 Tax=Lentzea californiensis TaxID=438851 RepID=UPI002165839E|nr:hypothetical protein [Lentzea californiensis]MCR3754405.1 hypothetical protein [Lentzea californiensis]